MNCKNVLTLTDPGLDPDDLCNAWLIGNLQKQGRIRIVGAIANYDPALYRAALLKGAFNILDENVSVGYGTSCNASHEVRPYEFDATFMDFESVNGSSLIWDRFYYQADKSVTLQLVSGLTDIYRQIKKTPHLLTSKIKEVYIMGGASWDGDRLVVDKTASNNKFDPELDATEVYQFFIENQIPMTVVTRFAAYQVGVTPDFYEKLRNVNALGKHLHKIQQEAINHLWKFAASNSSEHRQNRQWFSQTFCDMDDIGISADESPWEMVKRFALYDPITTLAMMYPDLFEPDERVLHGVPHRIIGVSKEQHGIKDVNETLLALRALLY